MKKCCIKKLIFGFVILSLIYMMSPNNAQAYLKWKITNDHGCAVILSAKGTNGSDNNITVEAHTSKSGEIQYYGWKGITIDVIGTLPPVCLPPGKTVLSDPSTHDNRTLTYTIDFYGNVTVTEDF
jgi:hypothetical protein